MRNQQVRDPAKKRTISRSTESGFKLIGVDAVGWAQRKYEECLADLKSDNIFKRNKALKDKKFFWNLLFDRAIYEYDLRMNNEK